MRKSWGDSLAEAMASAKTGDRRQLRAFEQKVATVASSNEQWEAKEGLGVLQYQQEVTTGLFVVVVLVWFSVPEKKTVICTLDRLYWLRGRGQTVGDRRQSRDA